MARGAIVASSVAAVVSDRFGRRKGMLSGCLIIWIGMIIAATSKGQPQVSHPPLLIAFLESG